MKTSFIANKFINFGKGIDVLKKIYDNDYVKTIIICYNKEASTVCPFKYNCIISCPPELYCDRHKTCARYIAAKEVGIAAVPDEMSAINYALIQTLKR